MAGFGDALFGPDKSGQYYGQATNALNNVRSNAGTYGNIYGQNNALAQGYGQNYQDALKQYTDYLGQNPNTDQFSTMQLNNATAGMDGDYQRAGANLTNNLASRGFVGDSSMLGGGQASLAAARLAALGNARNQVAMNANQQYGQNLAQRQNILNGAQGMYYGRAQDALGQQTGLQNGLSQSYMGIGNMYQQQHQQNIGNVLGGISSIASTLGGLGVFGGAGKAASAVGAATGAVAPSYGSGAYSVGNNWQQPQMPSGGYGQFSVPDYGAYSGSINPAPTFNSYGY